jgi:hypothetical protein
VNGKLVIAKSNRKFDSSNYPNYGKIVHSDRYHSQNKHSSRQANASSRKGHMNSVKLDSAKKRAESRGKYKSVFNLGMTRRKKRKN